MVIEIADFDPAHLDGVLAVILPIQQQEFGIAITGADQPDLMEIPAFYQSGRGGFWVARAGGDVVGCIGLKDIGEGEGALRKMFVAAPWRGREHGVAQRLLERLTDHAAKSGVARLYLGTTSAFLAAHRFYEKNGFELIDKAELPTAFPVMAVDSRFYTRAIA